MGQDCEKFIGMCLDSVKDADNIIYCDGGSELPTHQALDLFFNKVCDKEGFDIKKYQFIQNTYDQNDSKMNGKQRNFYLDYLKEDHMGEWVLILDADEIVEDLGKIKEFVNTVQPEAEDILFSVKMRHLIGDLGHEDATQPAHFVPHRLFKITEDLSYPEVEHPVLQGKEKRSANIMPTTIWHLAYIPNMWEIKKRYDNHLAKSNMHTPEYLKQWRNAHLFGTYPKSQISPVELPKQLLDTFGIDRDELYFANRGIELKHGMMVKQWNDFFMPESVADFGCGKGPYLYFWEMINHNCVGYECSEYAINNKLCQARIENFILGVSGGAHMADLVTAFDVLEHIQYKDLDKSIETLVETSNKYILVSVPVKGDPNLEADPTHIIKEDRHWWVNQFTKHKLKEVKVPDHFLFKEQLLIFEK